MFIYVKVSAVDSVIEGYRDYVVGGPIVSTLIKLGLPLMLVQLANVSYNIADAFWLSKYSDVAMAVPRQVWPLITFFNALVMALLTANMAFISQYVGARMYGEASKVASKFLTASVLMSMASGVALYALRQPILTYVVRPPPEIFEDVMAYSGIITLDLIISGAVMAYSTILQSIGDTRTPAVVNGISALTNIVLDPLIILGLYGFPRLGAAGAAIATVIARLIGLTALAYLFRRNFPELRVALTKDLSRDWIYGNLRVGTPVFVFHVSNSLAFMLQNSLVNSFGAVVATAFAIGFIVMDIADAVVWGLTTPTAIMVGQNLGAGNISRSREVAIKSALTVGGLSTAGAMSVYLLRHKLVALFTSDPLIYVEALNFLEVFVFTLPFFAVFFVGMSVGRGSGRTLVPTILGIIRLWVIRIGLGYILAYLAGLGSYGIWVAMGLSNVVSGLGSLIWIKLGGWAKPLINDVLH